MSAVDEVERCHQAAHALPDNSAERGQIVVEHLLAAHIHRVVVAPGLDSSVEREVLDTGHQRGVVPHIIPLIATHVCAGHDTAEVRILSGALGYAAPARVTAYVNHRAIVPVHPVGSSLYGRYARHALHCRTVPRAGQSKRNGKDCFVAVHYVGAHQQRYAVGTMLDSEVLKARNLVNTCHVEYSSYPTRHYQTVERGRGAIARDHITADRQIELPDFLVKCHH